MAKAFPFASGHRLGSHKNDDYEPSFKKTIKYYPFTIEDDGCKYYFDKHGNSVEHIWNAIWFDSKEEALEFGEEYLIFGDLDVEVVTKTEQIFEEILNNHC